MTYEQRAVLTLLCQEIAADLPAADHSHGLRHEPHASALLGAQSCQWARLVRMRLTIRGGGARRAKMGSLPHVRTQR